jgi:hypothetical protein
MQTEDLEQEDRHIDLSASQSAEYITALPDDWWNQSSVCQTFTHMFCRHVLPLLVSVRIDGEIRNYIYTGWLLEFQGAIIWVTVGHVINNIRQVMTYPGATVQTTRWLDNADITGAESLPMVYEETRTWVAEDKDVDLGAVLLPALELAAIRANDKIVVLTEEIWRNIDAARPEGFYVVGYPDENVIIEPVRNIGDKTLMRAQADLSCLPVRRLSTNDTRWPSGIPKSEDAFCGDIMPFVDTPEEQPNRIEGMSGGPVFSIQREPNGQIRYYLFGIQRGWHSRNRTICVVPIQHLVAQFVAQQGELKG